MNNQKKFIANQYEVEIWEGDKRHLLKINDATGTFRSIELDELSDETVKTINKYNELLPIVSDIIKTEQIKEEDQKTLESFDKVTRKIKQLNARFIKLNVKDWESNIELIDSVKGDERELFFAAIKRASLGITDEREQSKKKEHSMKFIGESKKPSLKKKVTRKRK
jgi:hypothetical protein